MQRMPPPPEGFALEDEAQTLYAWIIMLLRRGCREIKSAQRWQRKWIRADLRSLLDDARWLLQLEACLRGSLPVVEKAVGADGTPNPHQPARLSHLEPASSVPSR